MVPRPACPEDAGWIGRVHVAAWRQAYAGLLPADELARVTEAERAAFWRGAIAAGRSRIMVVEGLGFAAAGAQREAALAGAGWTGELYALYLLAGAQGRGLGRALFEAVRAPHPFTCTVLDGNDRARRFYARMGGRHLATRPEVIGHSTITEHLCGWGDPHDLSGQRGKTGQKT